MCRLLALFACCLMLALGTTQCSSSHTDTPLTSAQPVVATDPLAGAISVTTYHYDNARSGIQPQETVLTPTNVNSASFGKVSTYAVDGMVSAQPLVAGDVKMGDGKTHNLLLVATQNDSVYAFDADATDFVASSLFWKVSLLSTGEVPVPSADVQTADIQPTIGITGTPVLDVQRQVLYVVAKSKDAAGTYHQRLHALRFADGTEALNGPTEITARVSGNAPESVGGVVSFNPLKEMQRSALGLNNGTVWIAFASHGDNLPYHGWLLGYDNSDLSKQQYIFNDTPNGAAGGIWMAASGPSFDSANNMYVASGNGDMDEATSAYSESALKLTPGPVGTITVADYFSPFDNDGLNYYDADFGVSGPILLPDQAGAKTHLMVTADKSSTIYLLDRDNMGKYNSATNNVVQAFTVCGCLLLQNPLFFNNTLYVGVNAMPLSAFPFNAATQQFATTPSSVTTLAYVNQGNFYVAGTAPTVSANGTSSAILWALDNGAYRKPGPAVLHAYDPANLATEFYNSAQAANNRDQAANAVKFTAPVVANGRVYVAGVQAVTAYGLLAPPKTQ